MKYNVKRGFSLGDGKDVYPGESVDLPDDQAKQFLQQGKIEPIEAAPRAKKEEKKEDKKAEEPR